MRWTKPCCASLSLISSSSAESLAEVSVASICESSAAICACASRICDRSESRCSSRVRRRATNSARSRARCSAASGSPARSAGTAKRGSSAASAAARVLRMRSARSWSWSRLSSASLRTSPTTISGSPARTCLAVAHQDLAHDAAFLVLHGLAVELDLDLRLARRPRPRAGAVAVHTPTQHEHVHQRPTAAVHLAAQARPARAASRSRC